MDRARIKDNQPYQMVDCYIMQDEELNIIQAKFSLEELNFLAYRISKLSEYERLAFIGCTMIDKVQNDIRRLINLTYNLVDIRVIPVSNDYELGEFFVDNEFIEAISYVPSEYKEELLGGGLDLSDLSQIETHGTATDIGDPIEIGAIQECLDLFDIGPDRRINIGTIKANIGHLGHTSGLASLLKVLIEFHHNMVYSLPNYNELRKDIKHDQRLIYPNSPISFLPNDRRLVGINSFGFSGTNVHMLVENYPESKVTEMGINTDKLFELKDLWEPIATSAELLSVISNNQQEREVDALNIIKAVWKEVLEYEGKEIDDRDSFFELGGNSLLASIMLEEINSQTGSQLLVSDLYEMETAKEMADYINKIRKGEIE